MRFGVAIPSYRVPDDPSYIADAAQAAENLGYDSIWLADHLAVPEDYLDYLGPQWYEPVVTASFLAAKTRRVKIGWDVLIIPYRNPLILAKMVATLDSLCEGRVIFAGAAGYVEGEFAGLGLDFHQRGRMTDEYLRIYRELWTQEDPAFEGDYFSFSEVKSSPKPSQKPHPPVWIGGHSEAAIRRAALLGDGWHPLHSSAEEMRRGIATIKALRERHGLGEFIVSYSCSQVVMTDVVDLPDLPQRMAESPFRATRDELIGRFTELGEAGVEHATVRFPHHLLGRDSLLKAMEIFQQDVAGHVP